MTEVLSNPWVVQFAVFGAIAALVLLAIGWLARNNSRAEQRLEEFRDPMARKRREEGGGSPLRSAPLHRVVGHHRPVVGVASLGLNSGLSYDVAPLVDVGPNDGG